MSTYGYGINVTENSKVPAQTPPFKGVVLARIVLFPVAQLVGSGCEGGKVHT